MFKNQYNHHILDSSQMNLISNSQIMGTQLDRQSVHSLKPVIYNQTGQDPNETIMIDDIMSNYSIPANVKPTRPSNKQKQISDKGNTFKLKNIMKNFNFNLKSLGKIVKCKNS